MSKLSSYVVVREVIFSGSLPVGVTGKDVIITLCGLYGKDEVLNHAVEFTGTFLCFFAFPISLYDMLMFSLRSWSELTVD